MLALSVFLGVLCTMVLLYLLKRRKNRRKEVKYSKLNQAEGVEVGVETNGMCDEFDDFPEDRINPFTFNAESDVEVMDEQGGVEMTQ